MGETSFNRRDTTLWLQDKDLSRTIFVVVVDGTISRGYCAYFTISTIVHRLYYPKRGIFYTRRSVLDSRRSLTRNGLLYNTHAPSAFIRRCDIVYRTLGFSIDIFVVFIFLHESGFSKYCFSAEIPSIIYIICIFSSQ